MLSSIRQALQIQPVLLFLAGPNGAGKSTFFDRFLAELGLPFVNADRLATVMREADPAASQADIDRRAFEQAERFRRDLVEAGVSFCTESVFSDPVGAKIGALQKARARGFAVFLIFVGVNTPLLSVGRVQHRVSLGGHDITDEKLYSRFPRTMANLQSAVAVVDEALLIDNTSDEQPYRVVAAYEQGRLVYQNPPLPAWTRGLPGL